VMVADREAGLGEPVMARLESLAGFTEVPGELTRLYLSPAHKSAALQVEQWMIGAGMEVAIDAVGNVVGRYEGRESGRPALLLGSHIDTVRNAGKYDGALGVLAAIEAVAGLHASGERRPFPIEVVAFGDEEGVRFPVTLTGSRALAGTLDPAALDAKDADGMSLREALQQFGCDPLQISKVPRPPEDVLGYLEVHIEQGPVLEAEGLPVGVVTAINGASRFVVDLTGEAGHAGTVPMTLRKDALAAAAEMILAIERRATATSGLVATVGVIEAMPGAVYVVPGAARFSIDIRARADSVRADAIAGLERDLAAIAERRGIGMAMRRTYDAPAATCAPWLVEELEAAVARTGIRPRRLSSGAGHDALAMVDLCPIGMLFVRCKGGVSHNPAEQVTAEDAAAAVRVLLDFLRHLDPATATAREGQTTP